MCGADPLRSTIHGGGTAPLQSGAWKQPYLLERASLRCGQPQREFAATIGSAAWAALSWFPRRWPYRLEVLLPAGTYGSSRDIPLGKGTIEAQIYSRHQMTCEDFAARTLPAEPSGCEITDVRAGSFGTLETPWDLAEKTHGAQGKE